MGSWLIVAVTLYAIASEYFAVPGRDTVEIPEEMEGKLVYAPLPSNRK